MTTLRFLSILFLLLNVLIFVATRGWHGIDRWPDVTEPERAAQQIHPERITVLGQTPPASAPPVAIEITQRPQQPEQPAPAAPPAPVAPPQPPPKICLSWSGLNASQGNRLVSLLRAAGIQAKARNIEAPAAWKVRVPPLPTREAAEILADNIVNNLGIAQDGVMVEEAGAKKYVISLGVFSNRGNATRHLEEVKARGVHNAEIEARNAVERHIEATVAPAKAEAALAGQPFARLYKPCRQ
jgi:hypothetical protein